MGHALAEAEAAMVALAAVPAHDLADGESQERLARLAAQMEAVQCRAAAAFDSSGDWALDGARSAAAWLTAKCRVTKTKTSRSVRLGRAVRHLPHAERAWLAGSIHGDHVEALDRARTPSATDAFAESEADLVRVAADKPWHRFLREVAYWRQLHDEEQTEKDAARLYDDRRLHLSPSFQEQWFLDGLLDPIGGTIVANQLRRIEQELFQHDWREAKQRLGRDPLADELRRSPGQRRADALVEMAILAGTAPKDGKRPAPLFTVLVDYETFAGRLCQLANGTVVTPGSLVRWLDDAYVRRVVFDGKSRPIDVGPRRRLFEGATREAVEVKDLFECFDDLCDEAGEHLQVDHIEPYYVGGDTVERNGRMACDHHNRWRVRRLRKPPSRGP